MRGLGSFVRTWASVCALLSVFPTITQANEVKSAPHWSPWIEFGGYYSNERARGEAAMFVPLWQSRAGMLFTDLRGKLFEYSTQEANFALGYRHMLNSGWNVGVWGAYDMRRSQTGNHYQQLAGGLELLSHNWDFRLNGYLPLEDGTLLSTGATSYTGTVQVSGSQIVMVTDAITSSQRELTLHGADAEIGARVPLERLFDVGHLDGLHHELRLYAGGYWFDNVDLDSAMVGTKLRAEWRINHVFAALPDSRITLQSEFTDDNLRGSRLEVGARLRIPFGASQGNSAPLSAQERRMTEGLVRDVDVVTQARTIQSKKTIQEGVSDALTGTNLNTVVTVANGNNLQTAVTNAGANSLIVVQGGGATFSQVSMSASQTMIGGGSSVELRGRTTGANATYKADGTMPHIVATANNWGLQVGSNSHIAGFEISGSGPYNGTNANNDGIIVSTSATAAVTDVNIHDLGGSAIYAAPGYVDLSFKNLNIQDVRDGLWLQGSSGSKLSIANSVIDTTVRSGVVLDVASNNSLVEMSNLTISNISDHALDVRAANRITLNNSTFSGNIGGNGIDLSAAGSTLVGSGNTATGATIGGALCNAVGGHTGSIGFGSPAATCP